MQLEKKEITIEELRQIDGFETMSAEELSKVIESIKEIALIMNLIPSDAQYLKK